MRNELTETLLIALMVIIVGVNGYWIGAAKKNSDILNRMGYTPKKVRAYCQYKEIDVEEFIAKAEMRERYEPATKSEE